MTPYITQQAREMLTKAVARRLLPEARRQFAAWTAQAGEGSRRALFMAFSALPRTVGKADLAPQQDELAEAREWAAGCGLRDWSLDQAARASLLLHFPASRETEHVEALRLLFSAADVREQMALLRFLPLLPFPRLYQGFAEAGVRSSITAVFEAIAFENAYPYAQFDVPQWNRMVLKALFQDLGVERIVGLETRRNAELARMAADLVNERRAARRPLPPGVDRVAQKSEEPT
jgi:hypothetical protein